MSKKGITLRVTQDVEQVDARPGYVMIQVVHVHMPASMVWDRKKNPDGIWRDDEFQYPEWTEENPLVGRINNFSFGGSLEPTGILSVASKVGQHLPALKSGDLITFTGYNVMELVTQPLP